MCPLARLWPVWANESGGGGLVGLGHCPPHLCWLAWGGGGGVAAACHRPAACAGPRCVPLRDSGGVRHAAPHVPVVPVGAWPGKERGPVLSALHGLTWALCCVVLCCSVHPRSCAFVRVCVVLCAFVWCVCLCSVVLVGVVAHLSYKSHTVSVVDTRVLFPLPLPLPNDAFDVTPRLPAGLRRIRARRL